MPDPLVAHVIGTAALLGAALLVVASVTMVQHANYIGSMNVMLSEVAEACAREIVELVSLHTLGGGEYTHMLLTLPPSLGGQPYSLTLESVTENTMLVRAQLQLFHQVKVVVTPNFGQAPIYAVREATRFGELVVTPTVLLPTPPGQRAALVAVKTGTAILVGFTTQQPAPVSMGAPPECKFLEWTREVEGPIGSAAELGFTVHNPGSRPAVVSVRVLDGAGSVRGEVSTTVEDEGVATVHVPALLPAAAGRYDWRAVCTIDGVVHDSVGVSVRAMAPRVEVVDFTSPITGTAGAAALFNVTLRNSGEVAGNARATLNGTHSIEVRLAPGEVVKASLQVGLPGRAGRYSAPLEVLTLETGEVLRYDVSILVTGESPYVASINRSVVGLPSWKPKVYVRVANPSGRAVQVAIAVNGTTLVEGAEVPARSNATFILRPTMPAQRGIYVWAFSLLSGGVEVDSALVQVEVRDLKKVVSNALLIARGPFTVTDSGGYCGEDTAAKKTTMRCVSVHLLWDQLGGSISQGVSIAVKASLPVSGKVYRGVALISADRLYEASVYVGTGKKVKLFLRSLNLAAKQWSDAKVSWEERIERADYYALHLLTRCDGRLCSFNAHLYGLPERTLSLEGLLEGGTPTRLGLLVDEGSGTFADVVVTLGDSRYITVEGLPGGWTVELWADGRLVDSASALSDSSEVKLFVTSSYILPRATLNFKDPSGSLILRRDIGQLVGGDIIVLSSG